MIDRIFVNGLVYTMEGNVNEAIAVSEEKIFQVGSNAKILELREQNTEVIDLNRKCVLPGFNDSHMHFIAYGLLYDKIDLKGACSFNEILKRGQAFIAETEKKQGAWVVGYGFDQNLFNGEGFPHREDVDKISNAHPILLDRICGHIGIVNTLALEKVGITKDTVIPGGIIHKDSMGNPNGIIEEAALDWFKSMISKPNVEDIKKVIERTAKDALSKGLTSVQTDDLESIDFDTMFEAYTSLAEEGKLSIRIYEEVQAPRPDRINTFLKRGLRSGDGNDYFKIGNIKLLLDGSLGARSAGFREPYTDKKTSKGILVYTQEELDEVVLLAHENGMQIACHGIGDGAIEQVIQSVEKAMEKRYIQRRHRIVHCQFGDRKLFDRMEKLGMVADIQPSFVASDYPIVEARVGFQRAANSYAWKTMLRQGIHLAGGSDCPVETFNPLWGIYCAVTRKDMTGNPENGWMEEEKLTIEEGVRLFTLGSAYASFEENLKGSIKKGKLADFVVLSEDIFNVDPEQIKDIEVLLTVVGGEIRFQKEC